MKHLGCAKGTACLDGLTVAECSPMEEKTGKKLWELFAIQKKSMDPWVLIKMVFIKMVFKH
jgi:hypothetical protein